MTTLDVELELYDGAAARPHLDMVRSLYAEVYAEPPYCEGDREVSAFAESWDHVVERPDFRLVVARLDHKPVGFAYGYLRSTPLVPDQKEPTFFIVELAVRQPWRRRGIARQLHDQLLNGIAGPISLTVRPEASPALAAYHSWGYQMVGRRRPGPDAPTYDVMVR